MEVGKWMEVCKTDSSGCFHCRVLVYTLNLTFPAQVGLQEHVLEKSRAGRKDD